MTVVSWNTSFDIGKLMRVSHSDHEVMHELYQQSMTAYNVHHVRFPVELTKIDRRIQDYACSTVPELSVGEFGRRRPGDGRRR